MSEVFRRVSSKGLEVKPQSRGAILTSSNKLIVLRKENFEKKDTFHEGASYVDRR
jgi:hypothetical protein